MTTLLSFPRRQPRPPEIRPPFDYCEAAADLQITRHLAWLYWHQPSAYDTIAAVIARVYREAHVARNTIRR